MNSHIIKVGDRVFFFFHFLTIKLANIANIKKNYKKSYNKKKKKKSLPI